VDALSRQEATVIAARLVHRVQARIALSEEKAKALEASWVDALGRYSTGPQTEALWKVAQENLDQNQIGAFREAIAKGLLPASDDKEESKSATPDCCSLTSPTKR
jgi:hypothetical protein